MKALRQRFPYTTQKRGCTVRLTGLLMVLVWASSIVSAQDDADRVVQSKIMALEKTWNLAYKSGDRQALDRILDDQIVLINDDGTVQTKGEFLASVMKSQAQEQQVAPESMSVHVFGNTATSTGVFRAKGIEGGKPYVRRERFVDTWVHKGGNWVCVATSATPVLR
jgi:ketosteroid isomerase-like protein